MANEDEEDPQEAQVTVRGVTAEVAGIGRVVSDADDFPRDETTAKGCKSFPFLIHVSKTHVNLQNGRPNGFAGRD